jgi:NhaP-type Na+/H+ and K+/H+ antiporter
MKLLGIILVASGLLMLLFGNISFTTEKKVVDIGPLEINKKEKKTIAWPNYAGAIAIIADVVVLAAGSKKNS